MGETAGGVNVYTCATCGWQAVTVNRDEGTTPFMIGCERCDGICYSGFYRVDQTERPTHEWYRPRTAHERQALADPDLKTHVDLGGLLLRRLAVH